MKRVRDGVAGWTPAPKTLGRPWRCKCGPAPHPAWQVNCPTCWERRP